MTEKKKFTLKFILSIVCFFILFFLFNTSSVFAAIVDRYADSPPVGLLVCTSQTCTDPAATTCWNSQAVGVTDCGQACGGGITWAKYNYDNCYQEDIDQCGRYFVKNSLACSTGDKYNSSNPPVMDAGKCSATAGSCDVGGAYKTCCSGGIPVGARSFQVDPYTPNEADCGGNTEVRCGGFGEPACGVAACGGAPTPTDVPPEPTSTPVPAEPTPTITKF